jgi:hypothetical protein
MPSFHVTISERRRRTIAGDETARREVVREIATTAGERLLSFGLPDDHVHVVLRTRAIGYAARDLHALIDRLRPGLELNAPHIEPIEDPEHLGNVLRDHLRQPSHHRMDVHQASYAGSCFPDLVGARLLPHFEPTRLLEELPGFRLRDLFPIVDLEPEPLVEATNHALRRVGVARLADLVASVFALPDGLRGATRDSTRARKLAAWVARRVGLRLSDLGEVLGITRQAASQLSRGRVAKREVVALRRRLALEEVVRGVGLRYPVAEQPG